MGRSIHDRRFNPLRRRTRHRRRRHPSTRRQIHRPAPGAATKTADPLLDPGWGSPRRPVRPRDAIRQPSFSVLAPTAPPLRDRAPRQTHLSRHMSLRHPRLNPLDHQQTPSGRQPCISGRQRCQLTLMSGADDVVAAVDVDHRTGGGAEPIGQQSNGCLCYGAGISDIPAERCTVVPDFFKS